MKKDGKLTVWDFFFYNKKDESNPQIPSINITRTLWVWPLKFHWATYWQSWQVSFECYFVGVSVHTLSGDHNRGIHLVKYHPRWAGFGVRVLGLDFSFGFFYHSWKMHRIRCRLTTAMREAFVETLMSIKDKP